MRDCQFSRSLRTIATVVLSFFIWTFGGVFDIAYAIKSDQQSAPSGRRTKGDQHPKPGTQTPGEKRPEEKFQKTIEDIDSIIDDQKSAYGDQQKTKKNKDKLKGKKTETEALDMEMQKQFKETEEKIKDLPKEIQQRHKDFVKSYDKNMNELQANLDAIDKAKTKEETDAAIEKTNAHIEKTKPPKKHQKLDPNKLPHRTEEPVWKEPRTKPEEFFNDSQKSVVQSQKVKPLLLAMNGDATGLLSSPISDTQNPESVLLAAAEPLPAGSYQVALAKPPTDADLAETIEVKFTPEIREKAQALGYNPVKLYEFVRNNFEYEPYYGSLKGAQQTLLEMAGNDFDQASLLIALLRASGIPARYVYGTVESPIEKIMNWAGGVTDPNTAAQILATAGVPGKLITEGGKIAYAQFEHCWIEAYVPYGNYRGIPGDDSIKTWIPLDPSFKQYEYNRGMDLYSAMGINGEQYIMDYITDTSPSPIPAELSELFPDYTISPYQFYSKRLLDYIDTNLQNASMEDILGAETIDQTKLIIKKEYPYLLGSLPYEVMVKGSKLSSLSDTFRHKISITISEEFPIGAGLSYAATLPELAGKRVTISYIPATPTDEALVARYGNLLSVPPYLINVKPVIMVNGNVTVIGGAVGLGAEQLFDIAFSVPNKKTDIVTNKIIAGDYSAVAIQYYKTPADVVGAQMQKLQNNVSSTDLDDLLGQMLHNIGVSYMHHLGFEEELYAKNFQMLIMKEPSAAIVTSQAITEWLWGVPYSVTEGGVAVDVDRNIYAPFSLDGNQQRKKDFMIVAGIGSSSWEDKVLESFLNVPSVSAAKLLKIASQRGIPIFTIDSSNISTVLPQLQVTAETINDIRNSVNAGKKVIAAKTSIQYNDWYGDGYIVLDPVKGSAAYLISGGLAGAAQSKHPNASTRTKSDWSAFVTSLTRHAIIEIAIANLDTPYIWGGSDPDCGFDCSGFVYYIFTCIYGKEIFGSERLWVAAAQYDYLKKAKQILPYSEKLEGDIVWRSNLKHTGIFFFTNAFDSVDYIIHASGDWCKDQNDPKGWMPPEECIVVPEKALICGNYKRVTITNSTEFAGKKGMHSEIGRPMP